MDRRKSLGVLITLLLGLFLLGGCGNNTEEGVVEAGGATVLVTALDITGEDAEKTNNTFVPEGGSVIIQAKVTVTRKTVDKDGKAEYVTDYYAGQQVTFVVISNNSGGSVIPMNGGITNSDGVARAVYTAGKLKPGVVVQDIVQAHIGGYSGQIVMTRAERGIEGGVSLTLKAIPEAVTVGQSSVITATVTRPTPQDENYSISDEPVKGQTVTFSFVTNNSGGSISTVSAVTDASGRAVTTYTAGSRSPTLEVIDSIQASSGGSTSAVAIKRTGEPTATEYTITVTANPATLPATSSVSIITATVRDATGNPAAGINVQFILSGTSGGSVTPGEVATDANGEAVAIFTGAAPSGRAYIEVRTGAYGGGLGGSAVTAVTVP